MKWNEVAPKPGSKTKPNFNASDPTAYASHPNAYPGFGRYDDLVRRARALGFRIIITITGDAPRWATDGGKGTGSNANYGPARASTPSSRPRSRSATPASSPTCPPSSTSRSGTSPTTGSSSSPPGARPGIYRNMVDAAIPQIRAANKNAKIFIGETAPVGRAPKAMGPKEFIRKWLCLNKRFGAPPSGSGCRSFKKIDADGYAHHPYGPTARVPRTRDVINMLAIRQLGKYLDRAARRAASRASCRSTTPSSASSPTRPTGSSAPRRCARRS